MTGAASIESYVRDLLPPWPAYTNFCIPTAAPCMLVATTLATSGWPFRPFPGGCDYQNQNQSQSQEGQMGDSRLSTEPGYHAEVNLRSAKSGSDCSERLGEWTLSIYDEASIVLILLLSRLDSTRELGPAGRSRSIGDGLRLLRSVIFNPSRTLTG